MPHASPNSMFARFSIFCGSIVLLSISAIAQTPTPAPAPQPSGTPSPTPQTAAYVRPDKKARSANYFKNMFGPESVGVDAVSAGFSTWSNTPSEWGGQWEGFGKRFASNMGRDIIKETTAFGLEEAFKLDSRYVYSKKRDTASKIKNALISPFIARNEYGKKVFGFPRVIGSVTANVMAVKLWYPDRYGWGDGFRNGATTIATTALFNIVKEFIHK